MTGTDIVSDALAWLSLSALALILLVLWLAWAARGGRAVRFGFKGLGIEFTVDTTSKLEDKRRRITDKEIES